jgi:hypothetical protein
MTLVKVSYLVWGEHLHTKKKIPCFFHLNDHIVAYAEDYLKEEIKTALCWKTL